ncbi:MAG: hypothetical protein Ct9H300mP15_24770 [Gemmatimonadota bacterium]|nr:MAG: hypothetical protein Ct9H300mP15_24770 [Gemmatimonadota bacterium]
MEWASVYTPLLHARSMGPLFFLGTGEGYGARFMI